MKTSVTEASPIVKLPFPKLMISIERGTVIFFSKYGDGVILRPAIRNLSSASDKVGHSCQSWAMDCFEDFKGTVELEND